MGVVIDGADHGIDLVPANAAGDPLADGVKVFDCTTTHNLKIPFTTFVDPKTLPHGVIDAATFAELSADGGGAQRATAPTMQSSPHR